MTNLQEDLLNLANSSRIFPGISPLNLGDAPIQEETIDDDVRTIYSTVTNRNVFSHNDDLQRRPKLRRRRKKRRNESNDEYPSLSAISSMDERAAVRRHGHIKNIMYIDDEEQIKQGYRRIIDAFGKQGYNIGNFNPEGAVGHYKVVHDTLLEEVKRKSKYRFFKNFIWLCCYLFEKGVSAIGHGLRFEGWARNVWTNIDELRPYFDEMTKPIYIQEESTGRTIQVENPSIINRINLSPELMIVFSLIRSAVTYTTVRNIEKLTSYFGLEDDDEEDLANLEIEEED